MISLIAEIYCFFREIILEINVVKRTGYVLVVHMFFLKHTMELCINPVILYSLNYLNASLMVLDLLLALKW